MSRHLHFLRNMIATMRPVGRRAAKRVSLYFSIAAMTALILSVPRPLAAQASESGYGVRRP